MHQSHPTSLVPRLTLALIGAALALSLSASASAQTERPFHVGGGAGAAIELHRYPTQVLLTQEFGWRFDGTTDGPFIALSLGESFANDIFTMQVLPRFGWDIALTRGDVSVLLAPSIAAGVVVVTGSFQTAVGRISASDAAFNLQGAFDVKLLLLDEALELFVRPLAIDVFADNDVAVRYNALVGARFRF